MKYGLTDNTFYSAIGYDNFAKIKQYYPEPNYIALGTWEEMETNWDKIAQYKTSRNQVVIAFSRGSDGSNITVEKVMKARARGLKCFVWTVDNIEEYKEKFSFVDGIYSNCIFLKDIM